MYKIPITLACGDYDRTRPLWDGSVKVDGLKINTLILPVEEMFFRMVKFQEFEVSELSMSTFLISKDKGEPNFIGIPVFPSRKFRHGDIYIRADSKISKPEDLRGKKIGMPEFQMTAAVWIRGILEEFYDVHFEEIEWFTEHEERLQINFPDSINIKNLKNKKPLLQLLYEGELDAIFTARIPSPLIKCEKWITRLFPNYKEIEQNYFLQTGIFPIMHVVVLKEEFYQKNVWAAKSIFDAFSSAKEQNFKILRNMGSPPVSLPWFFDEIEKTIFLMGEDFWPYGLEKNEKTINVLIDYMKKQKLLSNEFKYSARQLFAINTL